MPTNGDDIILATKPVGKVISHFDDDTGEEILTGYGREYRYLVSHGYTFDAETNWMILR